MIAFVVDPSLRVLLWSNGLVEATNLTKDTVEGRNVSSLPFVSEDNRDNTTAAIQQLFLEKQGGPKRKMVVALVPGAHTATREILLQFTAGFFEEYQNVVCVGLKLVGWLIGWLVGWLVVWLVGWLVRWLVGWWMGWGVSSRNT